MIAERCVVVKRLEVDLALRSIDAVEALQVRGTVPLSPRDALDLELESHGDAELPGGPGRRCPRLTRGSSDLRLLLSGYLDQPQATDFADP